MQSYFILYLILPFLVTTEVISQENDVWQNLFNGKDLENFKILNGKADFVVEENAIVGISKFGEPNSFLTTHEKFSDFILEFEVWIESDLNSGVQFRSLSVPSYYDGAVHGYQCEIESSPRKWAGGIYDESRRGWLNPLSRNEKGRNAFIPGRWNHFRIEAIGYHLRTYINNIQCANLVDDLTAKGFIAFQVHSIENPNLEGRKVKWKNIRIATQDLQDLRYPSYDYAPEISYLQNQLTDDEKRRGWRLLWDGKTTNGWTGAKMNEFPAKGWKIANGELIVEASDGGESSNGGDIVTVNKFSNFDLSIDFKINSGANSGIKYFVDTLQNQGEGSAIGLEFQILDDENNADALEGENGNRTMGSLYDLVRAESYSMGADKVFSVHGWNNARIVVKGGKVEHWLNHIKVVSFDRFSQTFGALVEKSKYKNWENFGRQPKGHILLQDHGDEVRFKNIKIREF